MRLTNIIEKMASVDIFKAGKSPDDFVGRPFYLDYDRAYLLINDKWKNKVGGIPQGAFLLSFYEDEEGVSEALLLRALGPTKLPTDNDIISSMIEYYKDNQKTSGKESQLDDFTRFEFSFSGLECRVLGTFYKSKEGKVEFGADVENFYSSHNYSVFKPKEDVLMYLANQRDKGEIAGGDCDLEIGSVRYSSTRRFQESLDKVPIYISPKDFLGKRTALFGMTRTGKSNTVKKIIESTVEISRKATGSVLLNKNKKSDIERNLTPFNDDGKPKYKIGQIVFDINGEYANANMQDEGTAIFELFEKDVVRYSVVEKAGFKVMKVNFYSEIENGYSLTRSSLLNDKSKYIESYCSISLSEPDGYRISMNEKTSDQRKAAIRYDKKIALYKCCLHRAGFKEPYNGYKIKFMGHVKTINNILPGIEPHKGISLDEGVQWFTEMYKSLDPNCDNYNHFKNYKLEKNEDYFDEDMMALLVFLTRKSSPTASATYSGYRLLRKQLDLHTESTNESFEVEIVKSLKEGKVIIVDLSQGNPEIQSRFSEKICKKIFNVSMESFIKNKPNNFIQFYFEEAHNLFPKKDDKDLSQIYNRIAKEGAKLNLGLIYATQEVSSISSNILKNTQNWFIAHLNNDDEIKELRKYYDFADFSDSLIRFSSNNDKGFVRMKTYSNPFVVPVQIDKFLAN